MLKTYLVYGNNSGYLNVNIRKLLLDSQTSEKFLHLKSDREYYPFIQSRKLILIKKYFLNLIS